MPQGPIFRPGDTNDGGSVDLSDAVALLAYRFLGGPRPPFPDAADADDGGALEISDAVRILKSLYLGSAPPAAPGPARCGMDPRPDAPGPKYLIRRLDSSTSGAHPAAPGT